MSKGEVALWAAVAALIGLIYATLPLVATVRKSLVEHFGVNVFDWAYWIFALAGAAAVVRVCVGRRGAECLWSLCRLAAIGLVYAWYLHGMKYAIERIHFLEYGLLGALLYVAIRRRGAGWTAPPLAAIVVYLAGLGDETIQWALPDRVGELRDGLVNLFSGILGMALAPLVLGPVPAGAEARPRARLLVAFCAAAALATSAFLYVVHGFGHVIESKDPGRFFSAFTSERLLSLSDPASALSGRDSAIFCDEAVRHLLQREFYAVNDFKGVSGRFYRRYEVAAFENRILERYYGRFLSANAGRPAARLLEPIDRTVAAKTDNMVLWPDTLRAFINEWTVGSDELMESRVKSTVITAFAAKDLAFSTCLVLGALWLTWLHSPGRRRLRAGKGV